MNASVDLEGWGAKVVASMNLDGSKKYETDRISYVLSRKIDTGFEGYKDIFP